MKQGAYTYHETLQMKISYDILAKEIHDHNVNVGWWDNPDECLYQKLQLVSTEISEATEGARKDLMDTHLITHKMEIVEYADAQIRTLDLGGKLELAYQHDVEPHRWCKETNSIGHQHLGINSAIVSMAHSLRDYLESRCKRWGRGGELSYYCLEGDYSIILKSIEQVAENRGFTNLESVIYSKVLYNLERADHKRENRAKENGKKF